MVTVKISEEAIPCEFCGKIHMEMVIDGHISQPHLCNDCWCEMIERWKNERDEEATNEN